MTGGLSIDRVFIKKSIGILEVNFKNEHFGVRELTKEMGVSRSQLYRKLKTITGKSTSKFICEFRLQKAMKMLQNDVATVSEIAYRVGFSSPTYFNFCFYKYYGYPPGEVKYQEPVSSIESKDKDNFELVNSLSKINTANQVKEDISKKKIYRISLIVMILIIAFSYYMFQDSSNNTILPKKKKDPIPSLAVLPFKNISNETENQYLADGLWDDLLNHLSAIKGLDVRSRQSLKVYQGSDKSMIDIGKELSAAYILESSIQKFDNKVRIITKLIDAKSDKHLWSHEYDYELKDIFKIQCEIAKLITQELNVILTDKEEIFLETLSTENIAAYQLVLKGRSLLGSHTQKDLEKSIELYEQAIVLDSNYALAYAEIAQSYFILRNSLHHEIGIDSAKTYVERALRIDSNTFRAYAVRARIFDYYEEWDKCKESFEKAIALNPNDALVRAQYAIYFGSNKDFYNARIQIEIAQRLDPLNTSIGNRLFEGFIGRREIEKAEEYFDKWSFIYTKEDQIKKKELIKVFKNQDWTESVRFFEEEIEKDPNNAILNRYLGQAYDGILNDDINFLKYSKKAYELDSASSTNLGVYFEALVENNKFNEAKRLLQSQNLKSLLNEKNQKLYLWYYFYHQEKYEKAVETLKDSVVGSQYFDKGLTYAQLGNRKKVDSFLSIKPAWWPDRNKAFVYAVLKEKDSMYYYLQKIDDPNGIKGPNSRREFDPYRKEERYKALLKKHYLPITHWNE